MSLMIFIKRFLNIATDKLYDHSKAECFAVFCNKLLYYQKCFAGDICVVYDKFIISEDAHTGVQVKHVFHTFSDFTAYILGFLHTS